MQATHRVKDKSGKTIGFLVDGRFMSDALTRKHIGSIDNVTMTKGNIFRCKKRLSDILYSDIVRQQYNDLVKINPFNRDIQDELCRWKKLKPFKVAQVRGSRQIGKTTEILKFAYSNYEYVIYINMSFDRYKFEDTVINGGAEVSNIRDYCTSAGLPEYVNSSNTLLIIDEIQLSYNVYNSIRTLDSTLECDIIVTGSYLGVILNSHKFFMPAGTVGDIKMFPLSFREFCRVFKCEDKLMSIDIYGKSQGDEYAKLSKIYEIYRQIGGYPEIVKQYGITKDIPYCLRLIGRLLDTFKNESMMYFSDIREPMIFDSVYNVAVVEMCMDNRGTGNKFIDTVLKIANQMNHQNTLVSRDEVIKAVGWLEYSGIIGRSDIYIDGKITKAQPSRRMYFIDTGIANYAATSAGIAVNSKEGMLTETFAYSELTRLCTITIQDKIIVEDRPCFSLYGNYELDFIVRNYSNIKFGIEVKTNKGEPKSLKVYMEKKLIDRGIVAKNTKGGRGDKFDTIPIYTIGARFPYSK